MATLSTGHAQPKCCPIATIRLKGDTIKKLLAVCIALLGCALAASAGDSALVTLAIARAKSLTLDAIRAKYPATELSTFHYNGVAAYATANDQTLVIVNYLGDAAPTETFARGGRGFPVNNTTQMSYVVQMDTLGRIMDVSRRVPFTTGSFNLAEALDQILRNSTIPPPTTGRPTAPDSHPRDRRRDEVRPGVSNVRVRNASHVDFKDVVIGGGNYGDIKQGATTDYQPLAVAYRDAEPFSLVAGTEALKGHAIDYLGARRLGGGHFTYVLTLQDDRVLIVAAEDAE